jgi:hypothetical protein
MDRERTAQAVTFRLPLASSFLPSLSCGLRRGRATSSPRWRATAGSACQWIEKVQPKLRPSGFPWHPAFSPIVLRPAARPRYLVLLQGGALPPGAHANGLRKDRPSRDLPASLGIQLSPPLSCGLRRGRATWSFSKVARYRRERMPMDRERTAQAVTFRLPLASSFLPSLSCGLRRGRATFAGKPPARRPLNFSISASRNFSFYLPGLRSFVDSANHSRHALNSASSRAS